MAFLKNIERPALLPLTPLYALAVFFRNLLFDLKILKSVKFKIPVISIGNLTAGGTGKTPHIEYLASLLQNDFIVAVLSRGYKRKTSQFIRVRKKSRVKDVGDEPLQIRRKFPDIHVAVHKNRVEGIKEIIQQVKKLGVVLLDDAYQHRYVKAGLSILLIDYNKPVFNDILLPAGNLREPRSALGRADMIIVTKCPAGLTSSARGNFISKLALKSGQDTYFTRYEYGPLKSVFKDSHKETTTLPFKKLKKPGVSVLLVTGIANPAPLKKFIEEYASVDEQMIFPDHHFFYEKDIWSIKMKFDALGTETRYIITTEKDAVRLREADIHDNALRKSLYYIPVEVRFLAKGEKTFIKSIYKFLKKSG